MSFLTNYIIQQEIRAWSSMNIQVYRAQCRETGAMVILTVSKFRKSEILGHALMMHREMMDLAMRIGLAGAFDTQMKNFLTEDELITVYPWPQILDEDERPTHIVYPDPDDSESLECPHDPRASDDERTLFVANAHAVLDPEPTMGVTDNELAPALAHRNIPETIVAGASTSTLTSDRQGNTARAVSDREATVHKRHARFDRLIIFATGVAIGALLMNLLRSC